MTKVSVVINVLNSHEIVRRQIEHFRKMDLPDDVEIIFIDDGSNPPLSFPDNGLKNLSILYTNDKRPWTQGIARNFGASKAKGEYLMMTDIDHIFTKEAIESVRNYSGDKMIFFRFYGALDENGDLLTTPEPLIKYGIDLATARRRRMCLGVHGNTFAIKKSIFMELGGYDESLCNQRRHQKKGRGEDVFFKLAYDIKAAEGVYKITDVGPKIYIFPIGRFHTNGDTNPLGLFHSLSYEPIAQPMLD
jgi:glycosyltransferase involved in cell wall biosynthesis